MSHDPNELYEFLDFSLDVAERSLRCGEAQIPLTGKSFDTLCLLVRNAGRLVAKEELLGEVWSNSIVEENNIDQQISALRRALRDRDKKYIETVRGRGYRFAPPVRLIERARTNGADARTALFEQSGGTRDPRTPEARVHSRSPKRILGRLLLLSSLIIAISVFGYYLFLGQDPAPSAAPHRSLAVLPFVNADQDPNSEFLSDGITDTLIHNLSRVKGLRVMSRHSAFRFRGNQTDTQSIASRLGVEALVTGDLRNIGDKVVVNVRLIEPSDGSQVWGNQYVRSSRDILTLQNELAQAVAAHLSVELSNSDQLGLFRNYTDNPEAYQLFLRGRFHSYKITEPEILRSIDLFRRAIELDPDYALAHAALADAYRILATAGWNIASNDAFPQAKIAARRALEIDPNLPEAHVMLGWVAFNYEWDWTNAEAALKRAVELGPNSADAYRAYGHFLSAMARHDEALTAVRRARELDPLSPIVNTLEGQFLHYADRDEEAASKLKQTLELEANFWVAHNALARVHLRQGRHPDAVAALKKAIETSGGNTIEPLMQLGYALAVSGDREQALATLQTLRSISDQRAVPAYCFAMIHNGLGERDLALNYLERSVRERDVQLAFIKIDPRWDNLRNEPRFGNIMRTMNHY